MRPAISDRVKETTTTTGLAAYALAGAPDGFRRFRDDGNFAAGRPALYLAVDNPDATTEWELGYGALTIDTVDTLARSAVLKSTNDDLPVEWAAGTKTIACVASSHIFNTIIDALDSDLVTAGTSTAYTVTTYRPDAGLYEGRFLCLFLHTANGANPELKTDDEAFKPIVDINGNPPAAGSMPPAYYWFKFRAATQKWVVFSPFNYLASNGGTMTGALNMSGAAINEAQGADIASASTINLDAATGNLVDVTGNNIIVGITLSQGRRRTVRFTGTPTLTHGSLLVLQGGANIAVEAGDVAEFRGYAGGVVRCVDYTRASGLPVVLQQIAAVASVNQLKISTPDGGTSSVVTADRAVLLSSANKPMLASAVNVTINFGSVGAAGIDAGGVAANKVYHIWVIGKADGTISAIGSLSSTSPAMPSGYTFKARVGSVRTQAASAVFVGTYQAGPDVQYVGTASGLPLMASGPASKWTQVDVTPFVPSTAAKISLSTTSIGGVSAVVADNAFDSGGVPISHFVGGYDQTFPITLVLQSTKIYWSAGDSRNRMYCIGWTENL